MKHLRTLSLLACTGAVLLLASTTGVAHHAISAKFDDKKPTTLNPEGWLVHLEAETKDKSGPITYVIDGKIEGLAFHNRSITGTWKGRGESGPFKISRQ